MISRLQSLIRRAGAQLPIDLLNRIGRWWVAELLALCSPQLAAWLVGRGTTAVVISLDDNCVRLRLRDAGGQPSEPEQISRARYSPTSIEKILANRGLQRADVELGVRLPAKDYFHREFLLPVEAGRALADLAVQDLLRKTPFKPVDIYHDFSASRAADGKIRVSQWIARRAAVDDAIAALQLPPASVAFLDSDAIDDRTLTPFIRLSRDRAAGTSWLRVTALLLVAGGFLLAGSLTGVTLWRQQRLLDDLEGQLAQVKPKAQRVRALVNTLERKQAVIRRIDAKKHDAARLIDVWEEMTRVLPTHTWLTELQLSEAADTHEQRLVVVGYSTAAPSLVGLIDTSHMFFDASLSSPIARDSVEERERFSIQAKIHGPKGGGKTP